MIFQKYTFFFIFFSIARGYTQDYVIKSKGYLDVSKGKIITGKYIYIKNRRILKIDDYLETKHFKLINLSKQYIIPGLIDCHTHIFMTQTKEDKYFEEALMREVALPDKQRLARARIFLKQYLNEGFTSLCDLGNSGQFLDVQLKKEISSNQAFPNLFISGPGLATHKAQFRQGTDLKLVQKEYSIITEKINLEELLQKYINQKIDILKIYLDNSPGEGGLELSQLQKLLSSNLIKNFKKITFHTINPLPDYLNQNFPLKSLEHFNSFLINPKILKTLKFITLSHIDKSALIYFGIYNKVGYLAQSLRAHFLLTTPITLVFGPDFYFHESNKKFNRAIYVKNTIHELVHEGFTPLEIIKMMTINPAKSLNSDNEIGGIAVGLQASFIGVKTNPLIKIEAINNINFIMNRGKIIKERYE